MDKSAIAIATLFATKSCINFVNESFTPDKMDPFNRCLAWLGGHMVYSALLQAGTDPTALNHAQVARDFLAQNSTMFDALGACCTGNDIDPKHPDEKVRKKADPKGNKFETIKLQLEKIAGGELCGLSDGDRMRFWKFYALLFMAWRGEYYYVKSEGKQFTLVEASFTASNFCHDNPNREVLENPFIKILTLTHSQTQMFMMPDRKNFPPPVVIELDRHLQILMDKLHGKLLPDGKTKAVASGMSTYFRQRAKMITRDGNAIDDPTTEAWKVFQECPNELTPAQQDLLEQEYSYQTTMAWKDAKLHKFDLSKLSVERRAILDKNICYKVKKSWNGLDSNDGIVSKVSNESRTILDKNICYKVKKSWNELDSNDGVISKVSEESRAILENSHVFQLSEARRLLSECKVLKLDIQDGTIGIDFEKDSHSYVCTAKASHFESSLFQVGDAIVSLNGTLLFDKSGSQITQLFDNSINRSVLIIRLPELVQNQIKVDESLQCLIQVKALLSEIDQQSPTSIQQFVKKSEAIFVCGKGSPDGATRSTSGYTNVQLASATRSKRWGTFLETVDDPLKSLIEEAKRNFYNQRRVSDKTKEQRGQLLNTNPKELQLIMSSENQTGYMGVKKTQSWINEGYSASFKRRELGMFRTAKEAAMAYTKAHYNYHSNLKAATIASGVHAKVAITTESGELLGGFLIAANASKACGEVGQAASQAVNSKTGRVRKTDFYARKGKAGDIVGLAELGMKHLHCDENGNVLKSENGE